MPRKWYEAPVIQIKELSPNTKSFLLALDDLDDFHFLAGQFITLDLPIGDKRNQRWRSYSLANAPERSRILELSVVKLDQGLASQYLFNVLKIGDYIKFKGPEGGFVLPENIVHDMVFICTGTGIAPFRSMLWDILKHKKPHKKIHLIFGTRTREGILYADELEYFKEHVEGFKYSVALSREDTKAYYFGYVHQIYLEQYSEARSDVQFYLCGWTQMIDEAVINLVATLKYKPGQVKYELYG